MAQTPTTTTPASAAPSTGTVNCGWCAKPMAADAVRCPSCGKVTKAIYNQKIICYILCLVGGLSIGFGIKQLSHKKVNDFYDYYGGGGGGSTDHTLGYVLLIGGIIIGAVGIYYWWNIGKKLGTMMWR